MVLFNQIIKVFTLPDGNGFFIGFVGVSPTFIDSDHLGFAVIENSLAKKAYDPLQTPVLRSAKS